MKWRKMESLNPTLYLAIFSFACLGCSEDSCIPPPQCIVMEDARFKENGLVDNDSFGMIV